MYSLLLSIIYISFISLGLPDSLLGAGWPVMQGELDVPLSFAGIVSMTIACGTILSSLAAEKVGSKFGTGLVTAISVCMTAVALLGFSCSTRFWMLILWAIPYGLGAGAVDAALNNYVALHYASRHMSWLHCFWGVGASVSPYIMSYSLSHTTWESGYRTVAILQMILTACLFLSLPLWKKGEAVQDQLPPTRSLSQVLKIRGVPGVLITFFAYCALESTAGLWAATYLVESRGVDVETAAAFASMFYLGITAGRAVSGFISDQLGDRNMIRLGLAVMAGGVIMIFVPVKAVALAGLLITGFGCAPIYPSIIHATPHNFGKENSLALVGIQMASAYTGSTLMPPLFGLIAQHISPALFPVYLCLFVVIMITMSERLNKLVVQNKNL